MDSLFPRSRTEIAPGAVHAPDWLDPQQQRDLVAACREWAAGPAAMRHTRLPDAAGDRAFSASSRPRSACVLQIDLDGFPRIDATLG
jgi:class 3 adenylate cyclase